MYFNFVNFLFFLNFFKFFVGQSSRGIKKYKKLKQKDFNTSQLIDEEHWSRNNKYDGDLFLESNYRKHLSRHANK